MNHLDSDRASSAAALGEYFRRLRGRPGMLRGHLTWHADHQIGWGSSGGSALACMASSGDVMGSGSRPQTAGPAASLLTARRLLLVVFSMVLVVGVWIGTTRRVYDERFHLQRADQIARGRPLSEVFTEPTPSAVGPVFPLIHSVVQRVSHGSVRASRLVSLLAMAICIGCVAGVLRSIGDDPRAAMLLFCSSPFVVSSTLALTETLSLVFGFGAFVVIWTADRWDGPGLERLLAAAVLMGVAILTRQSLAVLALPLVVAWTCVRGFRLVDVAILSTPSILALLLLLSLWGGLVPPGQEKLVAKEGFTMEHVVRALAYCTVMGSLIQPTILWSPTVAWLGGAGLALNLLGGWWTFPVLLTVFPDGGAWTDLPPRILGNGRGNGLRLLRHPRPRSVDRTERAGRGLLSRGSADRGQLWVRDRGVLQPIRGCRGAVPAPALTSENFPVGRDRRGGGCDRGFPLRAGQPEGLRFVVDEPAAPV